jgi:hypothetical protein
VTGDPQLSWLFIQLRDLFAPQLDAANKYDFYGRMADAASGDPPGFRGDSDY